MDDPKHCCRICYNWRPVLWDGSKGTWTDSVARCNRKGRYITAKECCEWFSIVDPGNPHLKHGVVKKAKSVTEKRFSSTGEVRPMPPLRVHQQEAVDRYREKHNIPLLFEAGCGKTATILRLLKEKYDRGLIDSILVIAPNRVHYSTWYKEEVPLWLQDVDYDIQIFGGYKGQKAIQPVKRKCLQVVIVNVDTFSLPDKWEALVDWSQDKKFYIVLDEATKIKSITSKRTQRILYIFNDVTYKGKKIVGSVPRSVGRAILTGTPVTNNAIDLWPIFEFIQPNFWKRNYYSFQQRYCMTYTWYNANVDKHIRLNLNEEMWEKLKGMSFDEAAVSYNVSSDTWRTIQKQTKYSGPNKHVDELKSVLDRVAASKRIDECEDMPEQLYIKRLVPMGEDQSKAYYNMDEMYIARYGDAACTVHTKLVAYMRLQQISSGFLPVNMKLKLDEGADEADEGAWNIDPTADIDPGEVKWFDTVPKLDQLYDDLSQSEGPLIVLTRFNAEAARIYEDCYKNYRTMLLTGWKREGTIEDFQKGKYDIMVANIKVVSMGLNLQNSHRVFYYSNTFSLEDRLQSEGRIYRIGQKNNCVYTDYVNEDTIDMKIVAALNQRRELSDYIRGKSIRAFTSEKDKIFEEEYQGW